MTPDGRRGTATEAGEVRARAGSGILALEKGTPPRRRAVPVQVLPIEAVVSDVDIRGGRPFVAGTTLRVSDLAAYHTLAGLSPDQLSAQFELNLADVYAALSYYFRHKAEIDGEIQQNAEQADLWRQLLGAQGHSVIG